MARILTRLSVGVRSLSFASINKAGSTSGTGPWGSNLFTLATAGATMYTTVYVLSVAYFYTFEREDVVIDNMCGVFERGGAPGWEREFEVDLGAVGAPRPALQAQLLSLFSSNLGLRSYAVVVGACGTGKSTAVRLAVRAQGETINSDSPSTTGDIFTPLMNWFKRRVYGPPVKQGLVYFLAPTGITSFSTDLMRALECQEPFSLRGVPRCSLPQPEASWSILSPLLQAAALRFTLRHGRPAVLILDAMDLVAKHDPNFFLELQDFAKECADRGTLRVVFVFQDGPALPLLEGSSAFSRADELFEIGDISDTDAVAYLEGYGVALDRAVALVKQVTGGRLILLERYRVCDESIEATVKQLHDQCDATLMRAGVSPTCPLFQALATNKSMSYFGALKLLDSKKISALLALNILAPHPGNDTYTFYSRHVENFVAGRCGL